MAFRPRFVKFNDLTREYVNRDFQLHTVATDGQATVEELLNRADALGLGEIAFTEHVRATSHFYSAFAAEVQLRRLLCRTTAFVGVEVKAVDDQGTLDASEVVLREAEIVLGSVHRFPSSDGRLIKAKELSFEESSRLEFDLALGLLLHAPIHVLAHPGGMCQRAFGRFPQEYFVDLMQASLEKSVAIEINTSYTKDLDGFLALCAKINPLVSVGSDVHRLEDLGRCRDELWRRGIGCV